MKQASSTPLPEVGQTSELVPYMLIAARTMSVRDISSFLAKKFDVSISASTISRALNSKATHLGKIAEYLSLTGDHMARFYKVSKSTQFQLEDDYMPSEKTPLELLYQRAVERLMAAESAHSIDAIYIKSDIEAIERMMELWDEIPSEIQREIQPMILGEGEEGMGR